MTTIRQESPIYDALVAEQRFDPSSVGLIESRADRIKGHREWQAAAERRSLRVPRSGYRTPKARKAAKP